MSNLTAALVVLIAALGGFYGGFRYEAGKVTTASASAATANAPATGRTTTGTTGGGTVTGGGTGFAGAGGGFGGRGTAGKVVSLAGSVLKITDAQGQAVTVNLSASTVVNKSTTGSQADLTSGASITVQGQRAADGSITATTIVVQPAG